MPCGEKSQSPGRARGASWAHLVSAAITLAGIITSFSPSKIGTKPTIVVARIRPHKMIRLPEPSRVARFNSRTRFGFPALLRKPVFHTLVIRNTSITPGDRDFKIIHYLKLIFFRPRVVFAVSAVERNRCRFSLTHAKMRQTD